MFRDFVESLVTIDGQPAFHAVQSTPRVYYGFETN